MKDMTTYPPKKTTLKTLLTQVAWGCANGIKLECLTPDESIVISHPKSTWDCFVNIDSPSSRLTAEKVILNWVNRIFPKSLDECEWP